MIDIIYKSEPVCYSVGDIVLNPYGQICRIESMTYYPNSPIQSNPHIEVRLQEKHNVWCTYNVHRLKGVLEAQDVYSRVELLSRLGEKYE